VTHYHPRRSYRLVSFESEKMKRALIVAIHFDLFRDALFCYEDTHANAKGLL
jgi:hypothetical protein